MKAIELNGFLDEKGILKTDSPLEIVNQRVKIIVLIPEREEINDLDWVHAAASNPAFDFLREEEEDIYSITDGEPMRNEA